MSTEHPLRYYFARFAESTYRALTYRNSVYVASILVGAVIGQKMVDKTFNEAWRRHNKGKLFEDVLEKFPPIAPRIAVPDVSHDSPYP